jgi:formylglycine-generating enzyme
MVLKRVLGEVQRLENAMKTQLPFRDIELIKRMCLISQMKEAISLILITVCLICGADAQTIYDNLQWAEVGNVNNAADSTGYGSVSYVYNISKYETTISQYNAFMNAIGKSDPYSLYQADMGTDNVYKGILRSGGSGSYIYSVSPGSGNKPISWVNWFDAARYCNWLHNGASATSSTETGAYTLNGAVSGVFSKNVNAKYWIPTENEWYKAAYYDPTKNGSGGYWSYPTATDYINTNMANYNEAHPADANGNRLTDVGSYSYSSYYGAYDMGGNVYEWNDSIDGSARGVRGGSWAYPNAEATLSKDTRNPQDPSGNGWLIGIRVATVPEPSALSLLAVGLGGLAMMRRRRS